MLAKIVPSPNPRQHQQMRGTQRTGGQHHLMPCPGLHCLVAAAKSNPDSPLRFEDQTFSLRSCEDMKVGPLQRRFKESRGTAAAAPVSHCHLEVTDAFLVLSVVILVAPIADTDGSLDPGVDHRTF